MYGQQTVGKEQPHRRRTRTEKIFLSFLFGGSFNQVNSSVSEKRNKHNNNNNVEHHDLLKVAVNCVILIIC